MTKTQDEPDDDAVRARIRREVLEEFTNVLRESGALTSGRSFMVPMSDYEIVNLIEALVATGYASVYVSPLQVLHNGDWVGQLVMKLRPLIQDMCSAPNPNASAQQLAERANQWPKPGATHIEQDRDRLANWIEENVPGSSVMRVEGGWFVVT